MSASTSGSQAQGEQSRIIGLRLVVSPLFLRSTFAFLILSVATFAFHLFFESLICRQKLVLDSSSNAKIMKIRFNNIQLACRSYFFTVSQSRL